MVPLSRRDGHDLERGTDLAAALDGVDTIVDVTGVQTLSRRRATTFFDAASRHLHQAGAAAGVGHIVALSIVGIDGVDAGYYGGKLAHERAVERGPLPFSLLRATQFHEFTEQTIARGSLGAVTVVPTARIRPVAAREVAERLVTLATGAPVGRARDLSGPRDHRLIDLVRAVLDARGMRRPAIEVRLPGAFGRAMASGRLRGTADADRAAITFTAWLDSADAARDASAPER
ncbi:SDR family oxidoreductase [Microbacterium oleivorans]|uniref:SDR family oxidoreductase n=1 Tax=Microbacterium oleivorans TaxID=273677 RepID=UPI001C49FAE1|nr:3-beta hydroxysteroid dehydrogenase [Microbacterium oleivorans]